MKIIVFSSLLLLLMAVQPALANPTSRVAQREMNQLEMNQAANVAYQKSDAELNRLWKKLQPMLSPKVKDKLLDSQLHWIKFRDAEATAQAQMYEGGSIAPYIYSTSLKQSTEARIQQLKVWIEDSSH